MDRTTTSLDDLTLSEIEALYTARNPNSERVIAAREAAVATAHKIDYNGPVYNVRPDGSTQFNAQFEQALTNYHDVLSSPNIAALDGLEAHFADGGKALRKGSKGPEVEALQNFLADNGYDVGPIDGIMGNGTAAAVKAFQKQEGLDDIDGIVGPKTFAIMQVSALNLASDIQVENADVIASPLDTRDHTPENDIGVRTK